MVYDRPEYREFMLKYFPKSEFHLDIEIIKNPPTSYIKTFFEQLASHEKYHEIKDDFIYDEELDIFAQVHNRFYFSEVEDLSHEEVFFYPFMNKDEIKRIFNIRTSSDFLLRLRAEQVEQNMRLRRTFSKLKKRLGAGWSFTNYFDFSQYQQYLKHLALEHRTICTNIPHGTIHSSEVNGMCMKTPLGNIITLSYSLRHFLYYMNVFYFGEHLGISKTDTFHAFILATRIMLGYESLDFEIDPRGKLPPAIHREMSRETDWQMSFIIGHEYAHHYLGHLDNGSILKAGARANNLSGRFEYFAYKQHCEYEADEHSISESLLSVRKKEKLLNGAFMFFVFLDMYEKIESYLYPRTFLPSTHPEPCDRLWRLRQAVNEEIGLTQSELNSVLEYPRLFMDAFLKEYIPYNIETIETIGSVYLPGYKKKYLIDRLDI